MLSEGVHSFLDLVSAGLAFFTVRTAGKPADEDHPFGHGKFETLSSLLESLLLLVAAGFIVAEGLEHLHHPQPVTHQWLAMGTILLSMVLSFVVYRHNLSAAKVTDSAALHVNALHFFADVMAGAAVLLGLIALRITGWLMIDPLMGFAVAAYIFVISTQQVKNAILELLDTQLPEAEILEIRQILDSFVKSENAPEQTSRDLRQFKVIGAHDLRTRKSGATRHVDFHLDVCGYLTVVESHAVCDEIENKILAGFRGASVNIHVEPCEHERIGCHKTCEVYLNKIHSKELAK